METEYLTTDEEKKNFRSSLLLGEIRPTYLRRVFIYERR